MFITDLTWTAARYRAALDAWRTNAPATDDKILSSRRAADPRLAKLADRVRVLLAWRGRPASSEPVGTNWTVIADANTDVPDDYQPEFTREIGPSEAAMMHAVRDVIFADKAGQRVAVDGDLERDNAGRVVRMGALRFSDGTNVERCYLRGPGNTVVAGSARLPVGALRFTTDKPARPKGTAPDGASVTASNAYFSDMLGAPLPRHVPGSRKKRGGRLISAAESAAMLAAAWRNTDADVVTVTKLPAGLACGSARAADGFVGMKKSTCAGGGATRWEDIASSIIAREVWTETVAALSERDVGTLDAALVVDSIEGVGEAIGQAPSYARRKGGKRALLAANDNLANALKKSAA